MNRLKRNIGKQFHLQLPQKNKMKYQGINLTKKLKDLYSETIEERN
jgi:hypothetical protein